MVLCEGMKTQRNTYIAVAVGVVVVVLFIMLGFFSQGDVPTAAEESAQLAGPQLILDELQKTGGVADLRVVDITEGEGESAKAGDVLVVHYVGVLPDGTMFDSSVERGQPFTFQLGVSSVIQGWQQGLVGMKAGGRRLLAIPSSLGYGETGQGTIPPNATLLFDVQLLEINPAAADGSTQL